MNTIVMGTTNPAKIAQLNGCLTPIGINVIGVADKTLLPEVIEDGKTVQENARKKAVAYSQALKQRVISMDNALYIDGLPEHQQPGIHVRRIDGKEANSDDELLSYFQNIISSLGNRVNGHWEFGICIADPNGKMWETTIKSPRLFTSVRSSKVVEGYPLESIQLEPNTGKYISEMNEDEQAQFWQEVIGKELTVFVQAIR